MVEYSTEREFEIDADDIWAMLANFADVSWIPALEKVELEGEGVGMVRHITAPGLPQLHERMDAIDHEIMALDYSVPEVEYLKVANYTARAQVTPLSEGHCRLKWSCKSEAVGVSEAEAVGDQGVSQDPVLPDVVGPAVADEEDPPLLGSGLRGDDAERRAREQNEALQPQARPAHTHSRYLAPL